MQLVAQLACACTFDTVQRADFTQKLLCLVDAKEGQRCLSDCMNCDVLFYSGAA